MAPRAALLAATVLLAAAQPGLGADLVVAGPGAASTTLSPADLAALPQTTLRTTLIGGHGPRQSVFVGPLLFTVLKHVHAVDPGQMRAMASQTVLVTGSDGYAASLALGEIAPGFEGKQVMLAESEDGKPLGADHLHLVVPGDAHASRSVHEVARISVR